MGLPSKRDPNPTVRQSGAVFSRGKMVDTDDAPYRYVLWRRFSNGDEQSFMDCSKGGYGLRWCTFIGLNPSTADLVDDDPTVRRCLRYAWDWGYDGLRMLNLFAFRATDPKFMLNTLLDPVGEDREKADQYILENHCMSDMTVCAWGTHGAHMGRDQQVIDLLYGPRKPLYCLEWTKDNHPKHPLYLRRSLTPRLFMVPSVKEGKLISAL